MEAHDVVSQESNLHTATQLLNQNISMHAIPDLNENNNLESTLYLETAICNKHTCISANSFRLSNAVKSLKNQPLFHIKDTVGISIGTDGPRGPEMLTGLFSYDLKYKIYFHLRKTNAKVDF